MWWAFQCLALWDIYTNLQSVCFIAAVAGTHPGAMAVKDAWFWLASHFIIQVLRVSLYKHKYWLSTTVAGTYPGAIVVKDEDPSKLLGQIQASSQVITPQQTHTINVSLQIWLSWATYTWTETASLRTQNFLHNGLFFVVWTTSCDTLSTPNVKNNQLIAI